MKQTLIKCPICQQERYVRSNSITRKDRVFTGRCASCFRHSTELLEKNLHRSRGGKQEFLSEGYVRVSLPNHPKASHTGSVHRYVLVMENYLGRYLREGELVHHINGIKTDDRIENLKIVSACEHARIHGLGIKIGGNFCTTHCKRGHEFTPENTYVYQSPQGRRFRFCRKCANFRRLNKIK